MEQYIYSIYDKKEVRDFGGFWTTYSWWIKIDKETNKVSYKFILGDIDFYSPYVSDLYDWVCETYYEALEWWNDIDENYFVYDEEEILDDDLEDVFDTLTGVEENA